MSGPLPPVHSLRIRPCPRVHLRTRGTAGGRVCDPLPGTHPRLNENGTAARRPAPRPAPHAPTRSDTAGSSPRSSRSSCRGSWWSGATQSWCSSKSCRVEGHRGAGLSRAAPGDPEGLPAHPAPRAVALTLCVLTSSPTVTYTTGLATATMSEYSSIAKRSSGSGTWHARQTNLLSPQGERESRHRPLPVYPQPPSLWPLR